MKIELTKYRGKKKTATKQAEIYRIGACLAIEDGSTLIQIKLSSGQWQILAEVAQHAAEGR